MHTSTIDKNISLSTYTTYKIGGPADFFATANSSEELIYLVKYARNKKLPYFVLGCGANILFSNAGFRGLVIHNLSNKVQLHGNALTAESGITINEVINITCLKGLSGFEHFAGIPSSVGGAIKQNLHFLKPDRQSTYYIQEIVKSVTVLDDKNNILILNNQDLLFSYDDSVFHHQNLIILEASFSLTPSTTAIIQKQINQNLRWREEKQPQLSEYPSCGSVFKKIEGVGAGRLIERVGLKGKRIGNIQVSTKHANYLINLGGGTAKNVLDLIKLIRTTVKQKTGYFLEPEIQLID